MQGWKIGDLNNWCTVFSSGALSPNTSRPNDTTSNFCYTSIRILERVVFDLSVVQITTATARTKNKNEFDILRHVFLVMQYKRHITRDE